MHSYGKKRKIVGAKLVCGDKTYPLNEIIQHYYDLHFV